MENEIKNDKILLIGSSLSYMLNSIKTQLEGGHIEVTFAEGKMESASKAGKDFSAILIYADEDIAAEQQLLVYIKDLATEEDLPVFIMGYQEEMDHISQIIPDHVIAQKFPRPINVALIISELKDYFETHSAGEKKKILVVDDSGSALRMIKGWLDEKYQIILANSGMLAIKYLAQDNPDLILLDYEMPICDGKQVLEMIRAESEYSNVPVIFLTSKGDRESIMKVMSLKPEGYLLKSQEPKDIVKAIDDFFEKYKGRV